MAEFNDEDKAKEIAKEKANERFQEYDKNGDGTVTREEFLQVIDEMQAVLPEEYKLNDTEIEQLLKKADKNGDGVYSYDEINF